MLGELAARASGEQKQALAAETTALRAAGMDVTEVYEDFGRVIGTCDPLLLDRVAAKLEGRRWWLATLLTGIERAPYIPRPGKVTCLGGHPVANCSTLRDYPRRTTQWTIGKNFDGTGSFGLCLVTADELPAGYTGLHIESRLSKPGHAECKYLRDGLRRGTHDFPVVRMPDAGASR